MLNWVFLLSCFCKQFLAYKLLCTLIGAIILSINIQVGLNMHLYDDIGDASSSFWGSIISSFNFESEKYLYFLLFEQLLLNQQTHSELKFSKSIANPPAFLSTIHEPIHVMFPMGLAFIMPSPPSVTREVYCFPHHQLIFSFDRQVIHHYASLQLWEACHILFEWLLRTWENIPKLIPSVCTMISTNSTN